MKPRIARYHPEQKQYLSSIERSVVQQAEAAGEKYALVEVKMLKWLLKVAQRSPYPAGGRPPKVPRFVLDAQISEAQEKIAEIKAKHKQAQKAPGEKPTSELISAVIRSAAAETGYSEGYIADLLDHPNRKRKKISSRSTSGN